MALSSPRAQAKAGHRDILCLQHQRRSRSRAATQLSESYSTLSWTQPGWAVPPVPQGAGGTLSPAPRPLAGPGSEISKAQILYRGPPRVPVHTVEGFTAYRPHPDTFLPFQLQKQHDSFLRVLSDSPCTQNDSSGAERQHLAQALPESRTAGTDCHPPRGQEVDHARESGQNAPATTLPLIM